MFIFSKWVYELIVRCYGTLIFIVSPFHLKAKRWIDGRKSDHYGHPSSEKTVWFHAASLGEYEQARPVISQIKKLYPQKKIIVSFFSPSGYETIKSKKPNHDIVYLPLDTPRNARFICNYVNPEIAFFVRYEFWFFLIAELKHRHIPVILIAAYFRPQQIFFRWYGTLFRHLLHYYIHIFVQDDESAKCLAQVGIRQITIAGDPRFDRVSELAHTTTDFPLVTNFCSHARIFIAGSTWKKDEELIVKLIHETMPRFPEFKYIIAPHEINQHYIDKRLNQLRPHACRYSDCSLTDAARYRVLIIDNVGMLSRLYRYAEIAYVGGGFNQGIHNILEPAIHGIPIAFGPRHQSSREAHDLLNLRVATSISNYEELKSFFVYATTHTWYRTQCHEQAVNYFRQNTGATQKIIHYVESLWQSGDNAQ